MTDPRQHKLFHQFPLAEERQISVGLVPTPYHVYDGHGLLIGGTADLDTVSDLLQNEQVYPMRTVDGRALMAIWVCDFTDASLGPHNELQFTFAVSHKPTAPINARPMTLIRAIFANPDTRLLCHGLWNNTDKAVAYNREVLGLDARLNHGQGSRSNGQKSFSFRDVAGGIIFEGRVNEARRTPGKVGWELLRLLGVRQSIRAASQPIIATRVVNTLSPAIPYNADAMVYLAPDTSVVQFFDPAADAISFGQEPYRSLDFIPRYYQHFTPFRFVYLFPEKVE